MCTESEYIEVSPEENNIQYCANNVGYRRQCVTCKERDIIKVYCLHTTQGMVPVNVSIFFYHSVNVQRAHHLLGGIVLNEGGAEAVHMSQIWRRRPTGSRDGYHPLLALKISFCADRRLAMEGFTLLFPNFLKSVVNFSDPNLYPKTHF